MPLSTSPYVYGVAFSPDGKSFAVGSSGSVVVFDVDLESWQRIAGRIANRNFTRDERRGISLKRPTAGPSETTRFRRTCPR